MKLLIDTSVLIDHLRGGTVWKNILKRIKGNENIELYVPTIVIFELFSGHSTHQQVILYRIEDLLLDFQRIGLTEKIAQKGGELYRDLSFRLQVPDYIIAATALEEGAKVVTLNKKHFEKIPGVSLYNF